MILSKTENSVVWELNELLAADRRAKAFSEATVEGRISSYDTSFEEMHWERLDPDPHSIDGDHIDEEEHLETDANTAEDAQEAEEIAEPSPPTPEEIEEALEARYQEGIEEGKRQNQAQQESYKNTVAELIEVINQSVSNLPKVWPVVTDLALDIAHTVCLKSLRYDQSAFTDYLSKVLEQTDIPGNLPVQIKLSPSVLEHIDPEFLDRSLPDADAIILSDPELEPGDVVITYDQIAIDRILNLEFSELRDQLIAQFPDHLRVS